MPYRHPTPSTTSLFLLVMCWIGIVSVTGQFVFDFDCRRPGVDCGGGECDISTGVCDCSKVTGFEPNYRCQNKNDFPCSQSTYGDDCDLPRVQVDCQEQEMFVNINPDGTFGGSIYVFGQEGKAECQLEAAVTKPDYVENKDRLLGYGLQLTYVNQDCLDAGKTEAIVDGLTTMNYTREYFIQYSKHFKSNRDQKVSVKCIVKDGGATVSSQVEEVIQGNSDFKDLDVDSNADLDIITFSIVDENDQPLPSNVNLGDEIKLVFTLAQDKGYVDFSLMSCTADNTIGDLASDDIRSVKFVENDCPSADGQALFRDGVVKRASTITVSISAFMFSGASSKVGFECDVRLCREDNKDSCKKSLCAGTTSDADKLAQAQTTPAPTTQPETGKENATTSASPAESVTGQEVSNADATTAATPPTAEGAAGAEATTAKTTQVDAAGDQNDQQTTAAAPGGKRRRRRAAGDEEDHAKVYSDMTVQDPSAIVEEKPVSHLPVEKDCMEEPEVITVIAILSVIVLTLTLVTVVVVCHVLRGGWGRKKGAFEDEMGSSSRFSNASGSDLRTRVDPVHNFNIPRLEIRTQRPMSVTST